MAFDSNGIKFLLYAKRLGVDLSRCATIGRQYVLADSKTVADLFERASVRSTVAEVESLIDEHGGYCEGILKKLGSDTVESFDASDFESATHIHDLNEPITEDLAQKYSAVIDAGTLEHVFNYPTALKNCMEMVEQGGHFLSITPTNNFPGHGFYQFSPELFFRVLSPENGFEMVDAVFFEDRAGAPWYRATDPATTGRRLIIQNTRPAYLLLIARRVEIVEIFRQWPQQSDYSAAWEIGEGIRPPTDAKPSLLRRLPAGVARRLSRLVRPHALRYDQRELKRFDPFE